MNPLWFAVALALGWVRCDHRQPDPDRVGDFDPTLSSCLEHPLQHGCY